MATDFFLSTASKPLFKKPSTVVEMNSFGSSRCGHGKTKEGRTQGRGETWWLSLLYIKHVFSTSNLIYSMSSPLFLVKVKYQAHYTILYPLWWVKSLVVKSSFTLQSPSLFLKSLLFGISSGAYQGRIPNNPRMGCVTTIHDYSAHFREVTVRYHSFWPMITIIEVYILPSRIAG